MFTPKTPKGNNYSAYKTKNVPGNDSMTKKSLRKSNFSAYQQHFEDPKSHSKKKMSVHVENDIDYNDSYQNFGIALKTLKAKPLVSYCLNFLLY